MGKLNFEETEVTGILAISAVLIDKYPLHYTELIKLAFRYHVNSGASPLLVRISSS